MMRYNSLKKEARKLESHLPRMRDLLSIDTVEGLPTGLITQRPSGDILLEFRKKNYLKSCYKLFAQYILCKFIIEFLSFLNRCKPLSILALRVSVHNSHIRMLVTCGKEAISMDTPQENKPQASFIRIINNYKQLHNFSYMTLTFDLWAHDIKISESTCWKWCRGLTEPRLSQAKQLAETFRVRLDELVA